MSTGHDQRALFSMISNLAEVGTSCHPWNLGGTLDLDAPNLVHPHGSRLSASVPTPYSKVRTLVRNPHRICLEISQVTNWPMSGRLIFEYLNINFSLSNKSKPRNVQYDLKSLKNRWIHCGYPDIWLTLRLQTGMGQLACCSDVCRNSTAFKNMGFL